MAELLLGPVLRYVDETQATVWVETDAKCEVDVLGHTWPTFCVGGHHYAIVYVDGLEPGSVNEYEVRLDGEVRWPEPDSEFPPPSIRTPAEDEPARIAFGSCRVCVPHEPPYALSKDDDDRGREVDALYALALRMRETPVEEWPNRLLMIGDQVYADEVSPRTLEFIESRRSLFDPPFREVADFEEYTRLYWESWGEPVMRWLLSTIATAMVFDDHDLHDDWNISHAWLEDMRRLSWWEERIVGAFSSYWVYQHLGNLEPQHLHDDEVLDKVLAAEDGMDVLRDFAIRADRETEGTRWSYCRDYGAVRVIVIDSRAGRVLDGEERRCMVDDDEWQWICERLVGGHEHLVIATSLPLLLSHALHYLEAWNEAVCGGAWGRTGARLGEWVRRGLDLEHWAAFGQSLERLMDMIRRRAVGPDAPASISVLSGDVHHAYLAAVDLGASVDSNVWQAVCSPFRNPLDEKEKRAMRIAKSTPGRLAARGLARLAGVRRPSIDWRIDRRGPWFDNQIATITIDGRRAKLTLEKTVPDGDELTLERVFEHDLA